MSQNLLNQLKFLDSTVLPLIEAITKRHEGLRWELAELENDIRSKIACLNFQIDLEEKNERGRT